MSRRERIVLSRTLTAEQLRTVRGNGIGTSPSDPELAELAKRVVEVA